MAINSLYSHKSIRNYTSEPVNPETLNRIIAAGIRGSNTGNMQLYSIVLTQDADMKAKLLPAHFGQPMVTSAAVVVTVCADINRIGKWCEQRNADAGFDNMQTLLWATIDATIVTQNIALAAEEEGLGVCYLGTTTYNPDQIIEILHLPKGVFPLTTLTIGHPASDMPLTDRLPVDAVVHHEMYADYSQGDIDRFYAAKESDPANQAFVSENHKDNLAQVFSEVRYPRQANEEFSRKVLEVLRSQGMLKE